MAIEYLTDLDGKPKLEMKFEYEQLAYDFCNKYELKMVLVLENRHFLRIRKHVK